jgi:ribosomal protein S12 methylthiotransferase
VIRTTLIAGFPGETPEDHAALMTFLKEQALDKVGVFSYSDEEDTPAYRLPGKLDDGVKDQRRDELMALQMQISEAKQYEQVGRVERVLIEEQADEGVFVGRTATNAPDVDGVVYVHTAHPLEIGTFYEVTITDALEYDLIGVISDEHRQ